MNLRSDWTFLPRLTSVTVSVGTSTARPRLLEPEALGLAT